MLLCYPYFNLILMYFFSTCFPQTNLPSRLGAYQATFFTRVCLNRLRHTRVSATFHVRNRDLNCLLTLQVYYLTIRM